MAWQSRIKSVKTAISTSASTFSEFLQSSVSLLPLGGLLEIQSLTGFSSSSSCFQDTWLSGAPHDNAFISAI